MFFFFIYTANSCNNFLGMCTALDVSDFVVRLTKLFTLSIRPLKTIQFTQVPQ